MYKIKVDADRIIGQVSPLIYGHFIEHLGRCIEGGILDISGKKSDKHGFRTDVLTALRRIRPTILRWPGGCFADIYHWRNGIGPKDQRPVRLADDELLGQDLGQDDVVWDIEESNRFGTDEFIDYCREIGAEPYICANVGSGTPEEAAAWVEYCNGTGNTSYARERRANGHQQPHRVKYWGLGNEIDETGHEITEIGCMSARRADRTLCLTVLNRHLDQAIECQIELRGFSLKPEARAFELNGPDVMAENKMGEPEVVKVIQVTPPRTAEIFTYVFPAHSATVIEIKI